MVKNIRVLRLIMVMEKKKIKKKKRKKVELSLNSIICDFNVRAMRKFSDNSK